MKRVSNRTPSDIVVAVPAHNEADTIVACLNSVRRAIRFARRRGVLASVCVVVVVHASSDDTIGAARTVLGSRMDGFIIVLDRSEDVGRVRDIAARAGRAVLQPRSLSPTWIFSTDADTVVPRDWLSSILGSAAAVDAHCVVGLAGLDHWRGSRGALAKYDAILASKMGDGTHGHVYGANLAIRADAYDAVGGFPPTGHGEDQRLVDALAHSGYRVLRTTASKVTTSGRTVGRAPGGLAALLRQLEGDPGSTRTQQARSIRRNEEIAQ